VQAQTSSQQSTLLASFSQINEAFIQLLASVINALAGQEEENIENDNTTLPPVLSLSQYTVDLLNIANELKQAPAAKKQAATDRLSEFVQIRKDAMLQEIKNNPQAVINNALPAWAVSQLPQNVISFVEQRKQIRGKFQYLDVHYGDFYTGTAANEFYVTESGTGKRYRVHLTGSPQALTGDMVVIDGIILDDQIATTEKSIQVISSPNRTRSSTSAATPSLLSKIINALGRKVANAQTTTPIPKKVAVIMFNWQNDTRTLSVSAAKGTVFTNSNSSNSFYKENSFGKIELVGKYQSDGDVFGMVTVPYDNSNCSTMYSVWSDAADAEVQRLGFDLSGYDIKTYLFPSVACGWSGIAEVGGYPARSWIRSTDLGVITHELGHNLGSHHASSWSCTESGVRVPIGQDMNCVIGEYGDPYDVMGLGGMRHINNSHKDTTVYFSSLDWLDDQNIFTIDRNIAPDATYTITPIEWSSAGVQALRIPKDISPTGYPETYYYLEFRQPFGFDDFAASSPPVNGVTIRIATDYNFIVKSRLVDTTPSTYDFTDAPLAVGKTFTDPYKQINVTTLSVAPAEAQVRVSFGAVPCIQANPSFSINPTSASLYAGQSTSFAYTLTNNDTTSCPSSNFSITPTLPAGFSQSPSPINHSLAGGTGVSGTLIISSPTAATAGSYSITETAQNTSVPGNYQSTATLTMNILLPDTILPIVTINSPANGATVSKGNVQIVVSASDASGIAQIQILVDGVLKKTCFNTTSCSGTVKANGLTVGTHNITAQATDKGGPVANTATASITIIKK